VETVENLAAARERLKQAAHNASEIAFSTQPKAALSLKFAIRSATKSGGPDFLGFSNRIVLAPLSIVSPRISGHHSAAWAANVLEFSHLRIRFR
jgi:hypothetical protein